MMSAPKLPIMSYPDADSVVAIWHGRRISRDLFYCHVRYIASLLPAGKFAVNLCEDRYLFLVSFFATLVKDQTNLLPASRLSATVTEICSEYPEAYVISDMPGDPAAVLLDAESLPRRCDSDYEAIAISAEHIAAVVFTSGSTGKPKPNIKSWRSLHCEAELAIERFRFIENDVQAIVATVPAQHMYGLVTSIIIPLLAGIATVCTATFYPADIVAALQSAAGSCVLVSTPIHLKACVTEKIHSDKIAFVISATALMPRELAQSIEQQLDTQLYEIYGASEFGSVATRRTLQQSDWRLYDGMTLSVQDDGVYIRGPQLKNDAAVHDQIELKADNRFALKGRQADLVKIAGKRISMGELNQKLASIGGVIDGVFFMPQGKQADVNQRLMAFVVAPGVDKQFILAELKKRIDAVFLPRPIILVDELPRNATGKLPQKDLLSLYDSLAGN